MKIWIDENQVGFVSKGVNSYYFHLNEIYRDTYCGNVKYRTMTYLQFKNLYPITTRYWFARKKKTAH